MKLYNNEEAFTIKFNGNEYTIPAGEFETNNEGLAQYIRVKTIKWGKNITEKQVKNEPITVTAVVTKAEPEVVKEEPVVKELVTPETIVKEEKKESKKPGKNSSKIKELEETL